MDVLAASVGTPVASAASGLDLAAAVNPANAVNATNAASAGTRAGLTAVC